MIYNVMGTLCIVSLIEFVSIPCNKHYKMLSPCIVDNLAYISYMWNLLTGNFMSSGCML